MAVDGAWVKFGATNSPEFGGYDTPYHSITSLLAHAGANTKVRVKPGTSDWTGTLSTRMLFDAPVGSAVIGE